MSKKTNEDKAPKAGSAQWVNPLELVIFIFIAVYLVGFTISSINKPKVTTEVVQFGQIDTPQQFVGVVVRDETITFAGRSGRAHFAYNENEYVKKDTLVCDIKDDENAEALEKEIEALNDNMITQEVLRDGNIAQSEEIKRLNAKIKTDVDAAIPSLLTGGNDIAKVKYQVEKNINSRNQLILASIDSESSALAGQKDSAEKKLQDSSASYVSNSGGILSYAVDGLENVYTTANINELTMEQIQQAEPQTIKTAGDKYVNAGDPIFKVVNSNVWYIAAYLDNEYVVDWEVGINKYLYLKEGERTYQLLMTIDHLAQQGDKTYVVFSSSRYMTDFIGERRIQFSLEDDSHNGLKVPNSALIEKTALEMPSKYIYEYRGSNGIYLPSGSGYAFQRVNVLSKGSEHALVLQEFHNIKLGDTVYANPSDEKTKGNPPFTISEIQTVQGLYVANSGTAEFKQVQVLAANEFYSIIQKGNALGVKAYDNIITDATTVTDNQIIR